MLSKLKISRHLTAFFVGIFAVTGSIVAVDAPANAAADLGYNATVDSALNFNGTSTHATTSATVIPATGNFTVETWFKEPAGTSTYGDLIGQGPAGNAENRFLLRLLGTASERTFQLFVKGPSGSNDAVTVSGIYVPQGQWNHVAVSHTYGTDYKIYLNGQLILTQSNTMSVSQAGAFWLGRNYHSDNSRFTGAIDEVKIWNTPRVQSEIASDMHVYGSDNTTTFSTSLLAYYDMNEGSGTTLFNRTATSGLNLTTTGSPTFSDVKSSSKANGKDVLTFPRSYLTPVGGWTVPSGISKADILAVAGGGSGGTRHAGGGGAGALSFEAGSTTTPGSALRIQVGQGGLGQLGTGLAPEQTLAVAGAKGQSTVVDTLAVAGGGGGRGGGQAATSGGSGGGGNSGFGSAAAAGTGSGLKFAGNDGASTNSGTSLAGGGGGGAGSAAFAATNSTGSAGGNGLEFSITGTPTCYAAGGGGGSHNSTSAITAAGLGGDGCANSSSSAGAGSRTAAAAATAALPNSGSGGGGGGFDGSNLASGAGGSGIVVIAYAPTDDTYMSFEGTAARQYASAAGKQVIPASDAFTVEAWVYGDSNAFPANALIMSQGTGSKRFYLKRSSGALIAYRDQADNSSEVNCGVLATGQWVHVAVSFNNSHVSCFINGQATATTSFTYGAETVEPNFFVGQYSADSTVAGNNWKGGIDQVKVWTAVLNEAQVKRSMHTHADNDGTLISSGLTNLYDFNEAGADATVTDRVGGAPLSTTNTPGRSSIVSTSTPGANTVYTFPRTYLSAWGGWVSPNTSSTASALVVAGGGGAGKSFTRTQSPVGASGGGGGVQALSAQSLSSGSVYPVSVGRGGLGATSIANDASLRNGQSSKFSSNEVLGGGGGGSSTYPGAGGSSIATGGGGGGVGTYTCSSFTNGGGVVTTGFNGGQGILSWGGAGGGAGGASPTLVCSQEYGTAGSGITSTISGASIEYGRGGWAGFASARPSTVSNPGTGGSTGYSATVGDGLGDGSGFAGANGIVIVSVKTKNTVTFNANTGSGTIDSQLITIGSSAAITTNTMIKTGNAFAGWATTSGGTVAYADAASITPTEDLTLYAKWLPAAPVLYYNFSDRDSAYTGNSVVTNLGSNAAYTGSKVGTLTHDDATGKLAFSGGTNADGPYIDVADISTTQFADNGITIDFEADFGTADNWERLIDFGAAPAGTVSSNMMVGREGTTNNLWFEIRDGTVALGSCSVVGGLLNTNFARWTISVDGTNCKIYKDGVAQTTSVATTGAAVVTSAWSAKPKSGVTWNSNFIGRSNWTDDAQLAGNVRSLRMWAGVLTPAQAGAITYRTVNFDANYSGSGSLASRYTSGKTTLQGAPTRTGHVFGSWYDNAVAASGTLVGVAGAVISPTTSPVNLFASWAANVPNPVIVSQPSNITKAPGQTATFSVNATATGTASYQWQVSTDAGVNWVNVAGGTGATSQSYTTAAVSISDDAKKYRVNVTNTVGANVATLASSAATLTVGLESIDVNFDELNFDYANVLHVVGTNGKAVNNKVLFLNVFSKDGIQVDALVTTELLTNATIANYESSTGAGGANSYFQADVDISANNGFAQFKFDFYKHGVAGAAGNPCTVANPTCASAVKVSLQNVNVSAIDIDYNQWNDFTQAESYTMAGNTKLKECLISVANAATGGTCTVRAKPSAFPADMRFQGSADYSRTNDPVDMAIVTYAEIDTFRIKFGRSLTGKPNYFGVAFKALDWGSTTPQTQGGSAQYVISYNGGSADSGAQAGTHTGAAGATFSILSAGTFVKAGHSFAGWATSSTATTATYAGSAKVTMPGSNLTLYAVWAPIKYTLTYSANGGTAAPAAGSYGSGTSVTLPVGPTRSGYVFGGWDTVINSGTDNVNKPSGDPYSMPSSNTTLYAKWTIASGTLVYNGNSGETEEATVVAAGSTTTTIATGANTIRRGYDFAGWNSKADGTGTSYAVGSTFTFTATVTNTIYAQWTLSKYNLVFNVNGGVGSPQSQSYVQGATTTMPTNNPTREGFTFGGWNSAANGGGTSYSGSFLMPGNNLTLYAKWDAITYNVIYNNNSATFAGATGTVTDATNYTAAQSVTVAAGSGLSNTTGSTTYRFIGWNTSAAGTGTDYVAGLTFAMPARSTTLFAMWLDISIVIAYNANGGSGAPANANATMGSLFTINATPPQRAGYDFAGWNVQDLSPGGGPHAAGTSITPDTNETLVAQWTAIDYTVTYNSDSGSTAPAQLTAKHIGDTIEVDATEPTKSGYTFLGWKDAAGNIYPAGGSFIMGAGNVTLTAQWQGNAYALTYDANGGLGAPIAETRNYNAIANLSAVEPTRNGYTFQGWNTLVGGNGTVTALADYQMPSANTTLFADWTVNNFMLAYNTQSGSTAPSSASQNFDATVTVNANAPTRTGYTFAGWNTVALGTGITYLPSGTFKMPNANVTLYAQWTKTAFTLYYNTNGGQGVFSSQPIKYSESVIVDSTAPTKIGYNFIGWNTQAGGGGSDYSARAIFTLQTEANVTLYAKWQVDSFSLSYNANEGSGAPVGANHDYDSNVVTASSASVNRATYRFIGWNTRADGSGSGFMEGFTFRMPAENIILYAQWIDASFEIAYNANGGQGGPDGASADLQSTYILDSNDPVRPGYAFSGWKLQDESPTANLLAGGATPGSFLVTEDELLVAQWTIKTISVTYDLNGGSSNNPPMDGSGNYDADITLASSAGVTRGNFAFVGWSTSPDGTGTTYVDGSSFRLPTDNVILYAKWAPIYFIIDYNAAGGTGEPADQFVTPAQTVAIATEEPTKDGYEFDKWTEVSQGTDFVAGASLIMPSSNVTLVASYTLRAASVPGAGSNSGTDANTGVVDPGEKPVAKPKQLVLSVYFKGDSPVLTASTKLMLRRLAAKAKSYGRANNITIYGRVKETNDKSYDLRLSKARAANVSAYLKKFGVTGVFKVYGKGISPENTAKSRRVDMKLWWSN